MRRSSVLWAVLILPPDMPLQKRVETLARYFDPPPGSTLYLKKSDENGTTQKWQARYGVITVDPPKGHCLHLFVGNPQEERKICKKTPVKWKLAELDSVQGHFTWQIKVAADDFGTPSVWKTPYKAIRYILEPKPLNSGSDIDWLSQCRSMGDGAGGIGRRLELETLGGMKVTARLPEKDQAIEIKETKEGDPPPEPWTLSSFASFHLPGDQVFLKSALPPGRQSSCRYSYKSQYEGLPYIECHHIENYTYLFLPTPCLGYLK